MKKTKNELLSLILSLFLTVSPIRLTGCTNNSNDINNVSIEEILNKTDDLTEVDEILENLSVEKSSIKREYTFDKSINLYNNAESLSDKYTYLYYIGRLLLEAEIIDKLGIDESDVISFSFDNTTATIKYIEPNTHEDIVKTIYLKGLANKMASYTNAAANHQISYEPDKILRVYKEFLLSDGNITNNATLKLTKDNEKYSRISK